VRDGRVDTWTIAPEDLGVRRVGLDALQGGTPEENARRMEALLAGEEGTPIAEVVALNAAAALWVGGRAGSLAAGLDQARELLAGDAPARKLAELRNHR
jgi:anthranilate phosphoribosyltransferase